MAWRLRLIRSAHRDLENLPNADRKAIALAFDKMAQNLGSVDLVKLSGSENKWRLRVGRWRVIVKLDNSTGIIWALRIHQRKDAYRD